MTAYPVGSKIANQGVIYIVLQSKKVGDRGYSVLAAPLNYSHEKELWCSFWFPIVQVKK